MEDKLTYEIIAAAFKVHNTLGFGFLEKVYENAMILELKEKDIKAVQQFPVPVLYRGKEVGDFKADILVEDHLIIELKSITKITKRDEAQLVNYLKGANKKYGLLINFGTSVVIKRKYRDYPNQRK